MPTGKMDFGGAILILNKTLGKSCWGNIYAVKYSSESALRIKPILSSANTTTFSQRQVDVDGALRAGSSWLTIENRICFIC